MLYIYIIRDNDICNKQNMELQCRIIENLNRINIIVAKVYNTFSIYNMNDVEMLQDKINDAYPMFSKERVLIYNKSEKDEKIHYPHNSFMDNSELPTDVFILIEQYLKDNHIDINTKSNGIKIIEPGIVDNNDIRFKCPRCQCVFEAPLSLCNVTDMRDYLLYDRNEYVTECPTCHNNVTSTIYWRKYDEHRSS